LKKKEFEEKKKYQPIDYDAPVSNSEKSSLGLGAKIGIGVAIVAFSLIFAIGDLQHKVPQIVSHQQVPKIVQVSCGEDSCVFRVFDRLKASNHDVGRATKRGIDAW